jgi:hypothetical protein
VRSVKPPPDFFNRADRFSFKDAIALVFVGLYGYTAIRAMSDPYPLEILKVMTAPVGIILGGYFVQESASYWMRRSQYGNIPPPGMYGGYGYSPYQQPFNEGVYYGERDSFSP